MGRCVYSPQSTSNALYSPEKLMLGETLGTGSEFKLLRIRELDNDDVDGKPDSTDEDTPPNFNNELWCSVNGTLVASDEIQVKCVVYWKWPNVVDIFVNVPVQ